MRRLVLLVLLAVPLPARAQVLTIDVEATGEAPVRARIAAEVEAPPPSAARGEATERPTGEPVPVVVVVPPLEDGGPGLVAPRPAQLDLGAAPAARPPPVRSAPPVVAPASPPASDDHDEDLQISGGLLALLEHQDYRGLQLDFHDPEIRALDGLPLSPGFAGNDELAQLTGGVSLGLGMRAGVLRGPERRLQLGGHHAQGERFHALPGAAEGISASVRSSFYVRLETAAGVQVELGPVVPYAMLRAAVGGVWVDVAIRDATLGELGTETVDGTLLQLGVEAGLEIRRRR